MLVQRSIWSKTKLTVWVLHRNDLFVVVEVVQKRGENSPASIELIVTDKVGMVTLESIKDKRFVSLRNLQVREAAAVGKVKLGDDSLHGKTRKLGIHLDVNRLVGLDSDNKLVSGDVLEDSRSDILELDTDFGLLLVEGCTNQSSSITMQRRTLTLSGLQDKRHTVPSLVLNKCDHSTESSASRVFRDSVVFLVCGLAAVEGAAVLTDDDVLGLDGIYSSQDTHLFVTDIFGGE